MSTLENNSVWLQSDRIDAKYEKCRHITEEIYKRINITFEIRKLETGTPSDLSDNPSDLIDSNELSNETDLFACDKTDSISSSTEPEIPKKLERATEKYININNNEETKVQKPAAVCKRPKKRFRKRVKKRQSRPQSDTDCSSDEAVPLSKVVDIEASSDEKSESDNVMGVPKINIITKDLKSRTKKESQENIPEDINDAKPTQTDIQSVKDKTDKPILSTESEDFETRDDAILKLSMDRGVVNERRNCTMCSSTFRGERGLRRHMTISHIICSEDVTKKS